MVRMSAPDRDHAALFNPEGVQFRAVADKLIVNNQIHNAIWTGIPAVVGVVLAIVVSPWWWLLGGTMLALFLWLLWLIPRQVRAIAYAERDDDLIIRWGIMFRKMVVVPYGRMQYVDVTAGPLARKLGIASVQLHTASASTDASIEGLPPAEAERLREQLTARGGARLAGL